MRECQVCGKVVCECLQRERDAAREQVAALNSASYRLDVICHAQKNVMRLLRYRLAKSLWENRKVKREIEGRTE